MSDEKALDSPPAQPEKPAPPPNHNGRNKRLTWIVCVIFLFCILLYAVYWFIWAQFEESTDDAYVVGNMIMVTPQQEGIVTQLLADNTQLVGEGHPLVEIDRHDYEIALSSAEANLAETVRLVVQMFIRVEELESKMEVSEANLIRAMQDHEHRRALVEDGGVSREDFEHSETSLEAAFASFDEVGRQLEGAYAEIENTTVATHPRVQQAKAQLRKAYLGLHRCTVLSPTHGIITQRKAQVGQWVQASDPLMALVPIDQIWVDANFREVSLKNLRIGQPVTMFADMYGRGLKFHGKVVGLNPGTGSVFSILPPQNATGNWIKIIQRVPVRISLDAEEIKKHPLVLGLSMTVTANTHERNGLRLPQVEPSEPIYYSDVYVNELKGVEEIIDEIVRDNTPNDND
jgi:membrane fusion protein (multidrug efflux system)